MGKHGEELVLATISGLQRVQRVANGVLQTPGFNRVLERADQRALLRRAFDETYTRMLFDRP
ncbi:hypothetical protein [Methylocystis sp.]|uniref:hypothetical protein n=1 Tax=Methylocystis sp. TaxID=1911079 RepID=UPI00273351B7|nr:hypothetical protein [Methylocystis sp.]MDP3554204.1 hypothetical protein [Methylocystis sp.]